MLWIHEQANHDGAAVEDNHAHEEGLAGEKESQRDLLQPPSFWIFDHGGSPELGLDQANSMPESSGFGTSRPSGRRPPQGTCPKPTSSTPLGMDGSCMQLLPQITVMVIGAVLICASLVRWATDTVTAKKKQLKEADTPKVAAAATRDNDREEARALDGIEENLDDNHRAAVQLRLQGREAAQYAHDEEERRAMDVTRSRRREVALLEEDVEMGRILNGRLEGQLKAERKVRDIRQQKLKVAEAEAKERADKAEAYLAVLQGYLEEEKVKSENMATEIADEMHIKNGFQATSQMPKGAAKLDGGENAGVVGHASWKGEPLEALCTPISKENSGQRLRLDSPAATGSRPGVFAKTEMPIAVSADEVPSEEERHASSQSSRVHCMSGRAGGHEVLGMAESMDEAEKPKPVTTKLKQLFMKRVRKTGDIAESSSAMQLALHCPLSPTSPFLVRGDVLGEGRYGTVTRVLHKLGPFALKEVSEGADESAIPAARREMDVIVRLGPHPNVIAVKALDDTIPTMPILMEEAHCDYFVVLADDTGSFSMMDKISLLRDAGQGLHHMANHGVVHVDIKPDNLLVVKSADGLVGKIADFGHARACGDYRDMMVGTDGFIAMENLFEAVPAATNQDVFALAALMLMSFVLPEILENNMFAAKCLLSQDEDIWLEEILDLEDNMYEREVLDFHCEVMIRTTEDGSFYREMLVPEKLQKTVPCPEQVCQWLKACLSTDPSARPTMQELVGNLNELVEEAKNMPRPM